MLEISLFGGFFIKKDGRPLAGSLSDKGRALLAYLALEPDRAQTRAALADILWSCQPEPASRTNFRQTLHRVQQVLELDERGLPYIQINHHEIQLNRQSCRIDAACFTKLREDTLHHSPGDTLFAASLDKLQTAANLYKGDLLASFSLPGCSEYEWWLTCKQEKYHRDAMETLKRLVRHYELGQDYAQALPYIQRAIELEPWAESLHRTKMLLLVKSGQRCAALHQYQLCRRILATEFGIQPGLETTQLFHQIGADALPTF